MNKVCKGCEITLPIDDFYRHPKMADGRLSFCKICVCKRVRKHRNENDHVRAYDRARGKRQGPEYQDEWRRKNPEKYRAHNAVNNALRDGRLQKKPCEACGSKKHVHAHHHDYAKPLDVKWLCALHHHRGHAPERIKHK